MIEDTGLEELRQEAEAFVRSYSTEFGKTERETAARLEEISRSIAETGTYAHTPEELEYGAKAAWRNSSRCIGRLFWDSLDVIDARQVETAGEAAAAIFRHIGQATNGGKVRPTITIFRQALPGREIRIWNHQLIRYAGYERDGAIVGDPASVDLTKEALRLGWKGEGTRFDVLPLILKIDGAEPQWFKVPDELVLEVPLTHPEEPGFARLGLRWYAVPLIADMALLIGGLRYTAAPFNGWYMETEIGARNLADQNRYNLLPEVADVFGFDRSSLTSLWKDKALVELNVAVLHSFKAHGISIVDHHTAAQQFVRFEEREAEAGREVNGRWSWLIPPMSPAATPIWDRSYKERDVTPNYVYQERAYGSKQPLPQPAAESQCPSGLHSPAAPQCPSGLHSSAEPHSAAESHSAAEPQASPERNDLPPETIPRGCPFHS